MAFAYLCVSGNPALSLAHLQAGLRALAAQPMEADDFFEGMRRGAEHFLKHTGYGVFGGLSRMAGVASASLGALALGEDFASSQSRFKPRTVEEGLQQGVEALGRALAGGFTGWLPPSLPSSPEPWG